jgi:adenylyltransferase/sulfurtransferase
VPSCEAGGVLGVVPGLVGTIQAAETLKLLLGVGEPLVGRLLLVDARTMRFHTVALRRAPACPACGTAPRDAGPRDAGLDGEGACGADAGAGVIAEIAPDALARSLDGPAAPTVLDVREPAEHAVGHLAGARLIPLGALAAAVDAGTLDPARDTVVLCARGPRSEAAAALLHTRGFARVRVLAGGMERWRREGLPCTTVLDGTSGGA